jgi:hypothetical protein
MNTNAIMSTDMHCLWALKSRPTSNICKQLVGMAYLTNGMISYNIEETGTCEWQTHVTLMQQPVHRFC